MWRLIISFGLCFPMLCEGQTISGTIVDKSTQQPVSFVTVGLIKQNSGTTADEKGFFKLSKSNFTGDTILFSSVGYTSLRIVESDLQESSTIEMQRNSVSLAPIIISNSKTQEVLNPCNNCGNAAVYSSLSTTQFAQYFHGTKPNGVIESISVCVWNDKSKFRIRVYDYDINTMKPGVELTDTVIEVIASKRKLRIDLSNNPVIIPNEDFFIAIEWLHIPMNERNLTAVFGAKKITNRVYYPRISIKSDKKAGYVSDKNWQLNYNGKWQKFFIPNTVLMISPFLRY